jgi:parallel beta-helix repeat protein
MRRRLWLESLDARDLPSTYVVSPVGNDSAAGTSTTPWKTLQKAANTVVAGDQVVVRAGNYAGFNLTRDGTASARITFSADPGVTINAPNPSGPHAGKDGINVEGADYVTIEGFNVNGMTRAGIRVVVNTNAVIRNNNCDSNGFWGILTGFAENVTVENNVTSRSVNEHGIYVSNSADNPIVRGNVSFGNSRCGIHMNSDLSSGGDGIITGALIEGNTIYDNGRTGGSGINMDGVSNSVVRNNLVYGNHATGIALYRIDGAQGAKNNVVANNTVHVASDGRWALLIVNASTGARLFNNILLNEGSYRGSMSVSPDSLSGMVSNYNVVMDRFTLDDGTTRLTRAQWQAQTGQDANSIVSSVSALFVGATDYHLLASAPAVDVGTASLGGASAPTVDIAGTARPSGAGYEVGAFERTQTAPNPNPPTANGDSYTINAGVALTLAAPGVLANDVSNPAGRALTAVRVSGPSHGALVLNANGSFIYTPTAGYSGPDSFTYTANDGTVASSPATVSLTVQAEAAARPRVESVVFNDGSIQRSLIRSITVTFDSEVVLDALPFGLARIGGGTPNQTLQVSNANGRTTVVMTFGGPGTQYGSLKDGSWTFRVRALRVHSAADPSLTMAADSVASFHRFFGDSNGDRDTDATDRTALLAALGQTTPAALGTFDFDGDGDVDSADQSQFNKRYGKRI